MVSTSQIDTTKEYNQSKSREIWMVWITVIHNSAILYFQTKLQYGKLSKKPMYY
jgi:hypothetical protein